MCARSFADVFHLLSGFDLNNCEFAYRAGEVYATDDALNYLSDFTVDVYKETEALFTGLDAKLRKCRLMKYTLEVLQQVEGP
jgi:hypothetical protein